MKKLSHGLHCAVGRTRSPEAKARRNKRDQDRRRRDADVMAAARAAGLMAPAYSRVPPDHVIEERDRAVAAPRDLSAVLCGDPLPGRSALDRRT